MFYPFQTSLVPSHLPRRDRFEQPGRKIQTNDVESDKESLQNCCELLRCNFYRMTLATTQAHNNNDPMCAKAMATPGVEP